ncbi:MAG: hypothetical protein C0394_02130 [Syntrophus sp. (in: bacteria)]|nr:hypothetical protein [Syntrophus sp. (in: bacteria)]
MHSERVVRKLEKKVADLAQMNLTLRESEEKYRLLADNVADVIFVLDMNLNYFYVSPSVKTLHGYEPAQVMEQTASATLTLPPASWELAMKNLADALALEEAGHLQGPRTIELEVLCRDGSAVCTEIRLSFIRDANNRPAGILGVTRDITKRKTFENERQQYVEGLRSTLAATVQAIAVTVETRDPYTAGHQRRVADLCGAIAMEMGLPVSQIDGLRAAGIIHDIGKLSVPAEILSKPARLMNIEFSVIKTHAQAGYNIL